MAYTDIDKPDDYFNTVLYTGTGSATSITGVGFQPDLVWIKRRNTTSSHRLVDVVRGATNYLQSDTTDAEGSTGNVSSFDSDGFSHSAGGVAYNASGSTYASWNWLAGGTGVSNTQGNITSTVSANTTSGFSIVSWTGTGANGTVGHGLGTTPAMIITKARSSYGSDAWYVVHQKSWNNDGDGLVLNNTASVYDRVTDLLGTGITAWDSSTFTINQGTATYLNNTSIPYIGYCWSEVKGFSKFGSYTGNGSTDGTMIVTGMKPAFVMKKRTNASVNWYMFDNKRNTFNEVDKQLSPNLSNAEATDFDIDFLSNGFKLRIADSFVNGSGDPYIFMAFAESPFTTSTGIPTTAR